MKIRQVTQDMLDDMLAFIAEHPSAYDEVKYQEIRKVMAQIDEAIETPYDEELKANVDAAQKALDDFHSSKIDDNAKLLELNTALSDAKSARDESKKAQDDEELKANVDAAQKAQDDAYLPLIQKYGELVGDFVYKLKLTKSEFLSLKNLIYKKFVYDRETILVGIAAKNFIKTYDTQDNERQTSIKFDENNEFVFDYTISDLARLIQSTSSYKFPGLDGDAENFAVIMSKIIVLSKISEVFKTIGNGYKGDYDNKMSSYDLGL